MHAPPHVALSALAEGSDRLFADAALDLGFDLHAVLPFEVADYVTTFSNNETTPEFHQLLSRATTCLILDGDLAESGTAYERCGHALVDRSELLMSVWDGQPAAGHGGTPEIIAYALARSCPVAWVHAADDRPAVVLSDIVPSVAMADLDDAFLVGLGCRRREATDSEA